MGANGIVVAPLQDQADGPIFQTIAVFEVQVAPIRDAVARKHEQMSRERPETRGVRLDNDLSPEAPHLDPRVRFPPEDVRDTIVRFPGVAHANPLALKTNSTSFDPW
ncbi:hypothetical protein [Streptomyces sp. AP-93]|uniref:hypothetical protein n=1 Tax=Streptomyces sp. AP-93 TaxID=2929048 RepID=UPI001FAF1BF1|nr:hypothetical protein [Streptomyces sp. AP-93]MCJ0867859.1 hypothetical protein [Streptomyces sp. AP-93]